MDMLNLNYHNKTLAGRVRKNARTAQGRKDLECFLWLYLSNHARGGSQTPGELYLNHEDPRLRSYNTTI
jgi:hypothetical protein